MKSSEIVFLTLLFVAGFFIADFIVDNLLLAGPLQRFIVRVFFQLQFYGLIYLLFEKSDISGRLKKIEQHFYKEQTKDNEEESQEMEGN